MPLSELSPTAGYQRGNYRAPDRRPHEPPPPPAPEPPAAPETAPEAYSADVAFYANRFRADLTQLKLPAEPEKEAGAEGHGDRELFDFFGNLNVLLLAVRAGDLPRAQAAADALEMEVLVERSAGRRDEEPRDQDFGRLLAPAPIPPAPDPYAEADAGGAAYDTLAHYFDADPRIV